VQKARKWPQRLFPVFRLSDFLLPVLNPGGPFFLLMGKKKSRRFLCENSCSVGLYSVVGLVVCSTNGNYAKTT